MGRIRRGWKEPCDSRENMKEQGLSKNEGLGAWDRKKPNPNPHISALAGLLPEGENRCQVNSCLNKHKVKGSKIF